MKKIIYGAGKYGRSLLEICRNMKIQIDFFAQTNEPTEKEINGVSVLSAKDLLAIRDEMVIFLAIKNHSTVSEIKKMLSQVERTDMEVLDMSGFLEDNLFRGRVRHNSSGDRNCVICNNNPSGFEPWGIKQELFVKHHIIGSGYRENCVCPFCGSIDRERWLYYVVKNKTDIPELKGRVLHFAPEISLRQLINANSDIDYYTGDIVPGRAMHVTDILNIQYKDETFDYVISNHVMEHIPDEQKAVYEIKRVLKKNGKWIFSFPICMDTKTLEDEAVVLPEDRLREYGQKDHVRLYGTDYKERFERYGLKVHVFTPRDELTSEEIDRYGFIEDDVIMVAGKSE